jgi:hypothetical protein
VRSTSATRFSPWRSSVGTATNLPSGAEWQLLMTTHNLTKLHRHQLAAAGGA